jgi:hypothetical protein
MENYEIDIDFDFVFDTLKSEYKNISREKAMKIFKKLNIQDIQHIAIQSGKEDGAEGIHHEATVAILEFTDELLNNNEKEEHPIISKFVRTMEESISSLEVIYFIEGLLYKTFFNNEKSENLKFVDDFSFNDLSSSLKIIDKFPSEFNNFKLFLKETAKKEFIDNRIKNINEEVELELDDLKDEEYYRNLFDETIKPLIVEQYSEDDIVAINTSFNDWLDGLEKDGEIGSIATEYYTYDGEDSSDLVKKKYKEILFMEAFESSEIPLSYLPDIYKTKKNKQNIVRKSF